MAPVYNESEIIEKFCFQIAHDVEQIRGNIELILVNDGSTDGTEKKILALKSTYSWIKYVKLSRNFGHQNAVLAGLSVISGNNICIIDSDLQDDPKYIMQMEDMLSESVFMVYGRRIKRPGETWFKKITAFLFYRILETLSPIEIPKDTGDFRLIKRQVVDQVLAMSEKEPFLRGLFALTGFNAVPFDYVRNVRELGETKYPIRKMLSFGLNAILSFSEKPIKLTLRLALFGIAASAILSIMIVLEYLKGNTTPGWASIICIVAFFGSLNLFVLSIIGRYILGIWFIVQKRPNFVIESVN